MNRTVWKWRRGLQSVLRKSGHFLLLCGPTQSSTGHTTWYELIVRHPATHVVLFQVMMFNQQFSQMSLSRNNVWMLNATWYICSSDTTSNTNKTILVRGPRVQFLQRTGLSWPLVSLSSLTSVCDSVNHIQVTENVKFRLEMAILQTLDDGLLCLLKFLYCKPLLVSSRICWTLLAT